MTQIIHRHPDGATLMSFASGTLAEPLAAVVATHIAMCPACRHEMRALDALGGALLARLEGMESLATRPRRPDTPPTDAGAPDRPAGSGTALMPPQLAKRLGLPSGEPTWRRLAPGIRHMRIPLSSGAAGDLRFLDIEPGRRMPVHSHGGTELTLVLAGAFSDATGVYRRGDIQDVDSDIEHQPLVDAKLGCICLVASEAPARFKGFFSRLLQPLTGM